MSGPFKMKGSPMKRNFGISPMKHPARTAVPAHKNPHPSHHAELIPKEEKAKVIPDWAKKK